MTDLIVKGINPQEKIDVIFQGVLFGEPVKTAGITIVAPPAIPRINTIDTTFEFKEVNAKESVGQSFGFYEYRQPNAMRDQKLVKLYFNTKTPKNRLKVGDRVQFIVSSGNASPLNNQYAKVESSGALNDGKIWIKFKLNNTVDLDPNASSVSSSVSKVREIELARKNQFTISIPSAVYDGLVRKQEKTSIQESTWAVRDIPIYAYRNYDGKLKSTDKLLYMHNSANVGPDPVGWSSDINDYYVKSYTKLFDITEKDKYLFYVTVARYIKSGNEWTGSWLQTNSAGKPIWSKAKKA